MRPTTIGWMLLLTGCPVTPKAVDFSDLEPEVAVASSLDHLELAYSFTEHKQLDWASARETLLPLAAVATTAAAEADVYRRLTTLMPDAHVQFFNDDPGVDLCPQAAHGYGVTLADLDDGRVIVANAGTSEQLVPGDQVVSWNGVPIQDARLTVAFQCFPLGAATNARIRQVQLRVLERGPVGGQASVEVLRGATTVEAILTAVADTTDVRVAFGIELPEVLLAQRTLPSGMGYIAVGWEETYLAQTRFQRALAQHREAPGLVVDLRNNDGGMDQPAAVIAGLFSTETFFYETITFLNNQTFEQEEIAQLWVEPQAVYWGRPTAVLVDANTVSSGEGLAMLLAKMPQVEVFGFEGTAASFGSTGSSIDLPGGWKLRFPGGRSLDVNGAIQLDSDETLEGGVSPTHRIPWTEDNWIRHHRGDDVVLEAATTWLQEVTR